MTTLGRYRLVRELAEGGMGVIYRGIDTGWGGVERPVAIKLISPALARDPKFQKRFEQEARLSFLVTHPNVVQVLDIGQVDETLFMTMEWVDGVDLRALHRKLAQRGERFPHAIATHVAIEVARGLDYAHRLTSADGRSLKLVHRDVSASNVLLSWEGAVKLTDFGIAVSRLHGDAAPLGRLTGKVGYMSPEHARGEPLTPRSDVFALGVVLYEMLAGANPFTPGRSEDEALERVRTCTFNPPTRRDATIPAPLAAVVMKAMASSPQDRYATAAQLREALEACARSLSFAQGGTALSVLLRRIFEVETIAEQDTAPGEKPDAFGAMLHELAVGAPSSAGAGGNELGARATLPEVVPAPPPRRPRWQASAIAAVIVVLTGGVIAWRRLASPPVVRVVEPEPTSPPASPITTTPVVTPPVATLPVEAPPVVPVAPRPDPTTPARLSVTSDVVAKVFVDGRFVQTTPVRGLQVAPGVHVVRLEGSSMGLHLLPREVRVTLAPGARRNLELSLAGSTAR